MKPAYPSYRRTWAEIDTEALRHNLAALRLQLEPTVGVMAVVKANAYGHGLAGVVRALAGSVQMFGVANVVEAREVRASAPETPVFILGPALPEERREIVESGFVPSLSNLAEARAFAELGGTRRIPVHVALDTGMGRMGIWEEDAVATVREIQTISRLQVTGIASHLPVADEDTAFTCEQLMRFHKIAVVLREGCAEDFAVHVENSAGVIEMPALAGTMVRTGLALYGSSPIPSFQDRLRPVMTWKARVTLVREVGPGRGISYGRTFITPAPMRIATVGAGYADGYRRHLSGQSAEVLICGRRCPLLGRVTMDQILVDVTALPHCEAGEEVVLIGKQGSEEIRVAELAERSGTIAWDVFTGIGTRVERVVT